MEKVFGDWTDCEIGHAMQLCHKMIRKMFDSGGDMPTFLVAERTKTVAAYVGVKAFYATAKGHDYFSPWIGKCVCLCKANGRKVPDWIQNKNR